MQNQARGVAGGMKNDTYEATVVFVHKQQFTTSPEKSGCCQFVCYRFAVSD